MTETILSHLTISHILLLNANYVQVPTFGLKMKKNGFPLR